MQGSDKTKKHESVKRDRPRPGGKGPAKERNVGRDRNKREIAPHLSETHKLLTAVQFGDRASLLVRKRMSMNENGALPASKALQLLEQYENATRNYMQAVDVMCATVGLTR